MRCSPIRLATLAALAALLTAVPAAAGTLSGLTIPGTGQAGQPVPLLVNKSGSDCGFLVQYGDGTQALLSAKTGTKTWSKTWSQAGSYQVSVVGKKKNQHPACNGSFPLVATILIEQSLGRTPAATSAPALKGALGQVPTGKPVAPGPVSFEGMCDHVGCVEDVSVLVQGNDATFDVKTSAPSKIGVFASMQPLSPGSEYSAKHFQLAPGINQVASVKLENLEPGRTYHYLVKSRSNDVDMWKKGTFSTPPRKVRLTFHKVTAYDDGDDLSQGDFRIRVKSGGQEVLKANMGLDTGQTVQMLDIPLHLFDNPPEHFDVLVEAFESDGTATQGVEFQHWKQVTHEIEVPYHVDHGWSTTRLYRLETDHWDLGVWLEFTVMNP